MRESARMASETITPGEIRAELARRQIRVYELAPVVKIHPGRLGAMLSERLPMRPEVATRVAEALRSMPPRERPSR
jgi:plasmid maintenance system antidote protein VapI